MQLRPALYTVICKYSVYYAGTFAQPTGARKALRALAVASKGKTENMGFATENTYGR